MSKRRESLRILTKIAVRVMRVMNVDVCTIWLKTKWGMLAPCICCGIRPKSAHILFEGNNHSISRHIGSIKTPSQISNLTAYGGRRFKGFIRSEGLKSLLACPVCVRGKHIGAVTICTKNRRRKFTHAEKVLFSALADEVSFVMRNEDLTQRIQKDYLNTIKTIAHIQEANDAYTFGHSNKVMRYSVTVCKQLKMKPREIHIVKNAALLHDIGKIGIDRGILQKEGSLTLYEWEEIKKHPIIGAEIISRTEFLEDLIPIVEHHHARFTGGGYPDPALKRSNIPLGSKIIAIADAYDAMTSVRPYRKKPLTAQTALDEIEKHAGTQFDPHLSKVFIESMIQTV